MDAAVNASPLKKMFVLAANNTFGNATVVRAGHEEQLIPELGRFPNSGKEIDCNKLQVSPIMPPLAAVSAGNEMEVSNGSNSKNKMLPTVCTKGKLTLVKLLFIP